MTHPSAARAGDDAYNDDYFPSPSPRRRSRTSFTNAPMPDLTDHESFEISPITSTELPAQIKRELPEDPQTKALNHVIAPNAVMATLSSSRTEADAFAHYLEGIRSKGWIIETAFEIAGRKTIRAGRGESQMTLTFQASGEDVQITVLVASSQAMPGPSDIPIPLP